MLLSRLRQNVHSAAAAAFRPANYERNETNRLIHICTISSTLTKPDDRWNSRWFDCLYSTQTNLEHSFSRLPILHSHLEGAWPACRCMCVLRFPFCEKVFPHRGQGKRSSLLCVRRWVCMLPFWEKHFPMDSRNKLTRKHSQNRLSHSVHNCVVSGWSW